MSQERTESRRSDSNSALAGQRVACTGRLRSMTRAEVVALIKSCGGHPTSNVSRKTSILIVGEEGWPLKADGRLTRKLQAARRLRNSGSGIEVLREADFMRRVVGAGEASQVRDTHSIFELTGLLGVSRNRVRAWLQAGLIEPGEDRNGQPTFDFGQVSRAKSLVELAEQGVSLCSLRRSLQQLRRWIPEAADSLDWLGRLRQDGNRLVLQTPSGESIEPSGQRQFVFDSEDQESRQSIAFQNPQSDPFELAVAYEEDGDLLAAVETYRRLLEVEGPDAEICFNLGNALYANGETAVAIERFRQAVELDPSFAEAWLNLGNLLCETGMPVKALRAFQKSLAIDPEYADVHYSLADTLEELGRAAEARRHWQAYLDQEVYGEWAEYARSRLASGA